MYTQYKKDLLGQVKKVENQLTEVEKTVSEIWQQITRQMKEPQHPETVTVNKHEFRGWKSVRLFISSTFTDFFNEREILVKKVFPELREWCNDRRLKLSEIDLRWGIPADATKGETITICLEELDSCYQSSEGEPFFLSLLGERYGWVPDKSEVPLEVVEKYNWIPGTSITFMEIMHGALISRNQNAAFFFRDPSFLSDIPEEHQHRFKDEDPLAKEHIRVLKSKIKEIFPANTFSYSVTYGGIVSTMGRDMVQLVNLEEFSNKCLTFFKDAIQRKYPDQQKNADYNEMEEETHLQKMFIIEKAEDVFGREDDLEVLMDYIKGTKMSRLNKTEGSETTIRDKGQTWELSDDDNFICVVEGQTGWGKTSLLSCLVVKLITTIPDLFFHFCGSTTQSCIESQLLKRMIQFLNVDKSDVQIVKDENLQDCTVEGLIEIFNKVLVRFRQSERNAVIVIDAVNELTTNNTIKHLSWLPPSIPKNLCLIVSSNEHVITLARLRDHPAYWYKMNPLSNDSLKRLAIKYLANFSKRLADQQMATLMIQSKVNSPLWMMLMCEELRVIGDFRTIDEKILEMPESLDGLFIIILQRLQQEDDTGLIKKTLCSLASSEAGILSSDILKVLGDVKKKETAPPLYWAQAKRHLKPYIRITGFPKEYITFYHESIRKAVVKSLLSEREEYLLWQSHLADYYQYWCENLSLKIYYLPLHLKQATEHDRLIDFLRNDRDSMKISPPQRSRYFEDVRCMLVADSALPMTQAAVICQRCRKKIGVFNPGNMFIAENSCIICASFCNTFMKNPPGRYCSFHSTKFRNVCTACGFHVFPNDVNSVAGKLCNWCSFGINGKKCVFIGSRNR